MALIKKITPNSRNGDMSTLLSLILKAFANKDWTTDIYLIPIIERISAANSAIIEALNRLKVYSLIAEKDRVRDLAIRDLFGLVAGYVHMPVPDIKEVALLVNNILQQYGLKMQKLNYAEESADIESLLNDLTKADVLLALENLQGVPKTITALATAQKDFENVALQQAKNESQKKDLASASSLKKEIIIDINNNLVGYMNTMAKVKPATYEATAKTIAKLIDKNNELVKRRRKTNKLDSELV